MCEPHDVSGKREADDRLLDAETSRSCFPAPPPSRKADPGAGLVLRLTNSDPSRLLKEGIVVPAGKCWFPTGLPFHLPKKSFSRLAQAG